MGVKLSIKQFSANYRGSVKCSYLVTGRIRLPKIAGANEINMQ